MKYYKIQEKKIRGYVLNNFDALQLLDKAESYKMAIPFYQSEPHRKVFYDPYLNIYMKIVDENVFLPHFLHMRFPFLTADRYVNFYSILKCLNIPTPELIASLKLSSNNKIMSIIVTTGISNAVTLKECLSKKISGINPVIKQFASLAASIHNAGYYFSMDLRNTLVKFDKDNIKLFVLDLEHMNSALFAKRRIKRNLERFKRGLSLSGSPQLYDPFLEFYRSYVKELGQNRKK